MTVESTTPGAAKNVLFIMSDEHAGGIMGCAGHPLVSTPRLDRLAADGVRFPVAYTPSPICVSARASLATGLHVFEHGCWSSAQAWGGEPESWMHRASAAGAVVESIGKLHLRAPGQHGFRAEHLPMYVTNDGAGWPQGLLRDPLPDFPEAAELAGQTGPGESTYVDYDRRITDRAVEWLGDAPDDRPWVLFVSLVSPHYPLTAPAEFHAHYADAPIPPRIPAPASPAGDHPVVAAMRDFWDYDRYFTDDAHRDEAARHYLGLLSFLDHNVGRILDALDRSGRRAETAVIYTSDHGEMLGDHGFWCKSVMYEGSVSVPMLLSAPGIAPGVNPTPVSLVDIGPTIERFVGLDPAEPPTPPATVAARPLQDVIARPDPDRPLLSEYHDGGAPTATYLLRRGRWKYVHHADGSRPQLFDVGADPDERHDLGIEPGRAELRHRMEAELRSILDPEAVDQRATADKVELIERLGGRDAILALTGFNHTPIS